MSWAWDGERIWDNSRCSRGCKNCRYIAYHKVNLYWYCLLQLHKQDVHFQQERLVQCFWSYTILLVNVNWLRRFTASKGIYNVITITRFLHDFIRSMKFCLKGRFRDRNEGEEFIGLLKKNYKKKLIAEFLSNEAFVVCNRCFWLLLAKALTLWTVHYFKLHKYWVTVTSPWEDDLLSTVL